MARYYRRRYTRVVKPKKKWASNIREIIMNPDINNNTTTQIGYAQELCVNSKEVDGATIVSPTPTIVKTGNYKVQCDCVYSGSSGSGTGAAVAQIVMYIMYLPEGVFTSVDSLSTDYTLLNGLVKKHPEWIIAWKQLASDAIFGTSSTDVQRVQFSSRLKRNLNSGDRVCAILLAKIVQSNEHFTGINLRGMCQFWTCAN